MLYCNESIVHTLKSETEQHIKNLFITSYMWLQYDFANNWLDCNKSKVIRIRMSIIYLDNLMDSPGLDSGLDITVH